MAIECIEDGGLVRTLKLDDGTLIEVRLDDVELSVIASEKTTCSEIGSLDFREIEVDGPSYFKLDKAFLDKAGATYKRRGVGREALKLWVEYFGPAAVERPNGIPNDQGSHLTGDAPSFVAQMVDEQLLWYESPE